MTILYKPIKFALSILITEFELVGCSHISVFILPVGFSVVTYNPIGIGGGSSSGVCTCNFSVYIVVQSVEETLSQVQITNRVDTFREHNRSWYLPIMMAPVVLNTFHVPLVYDSYYLFALAIVNVSEEVFITLINEDFLHSWEKDISGCNVPID